MSKERITVFLDREHIDALEELKLYLPVDEEIKDSPLIRYALLELLNRLRKEEKFETKVLNSLSVLEIMMNAKLEQDHTEIYDLYSSNVYQDATTISKKIVRNKNYRFKKSSKKPIKEIKEKEISIEEPVKTKRDINDIIAQYLPV